MSLFLLLRFLHVSSAKGFIGAILARQVVRAFAEITNDVQRFTTLSEAAGRIERTMVIPGNFTTLLFGLILGLVTCAPILGFLQSAARNWLLFSNILLILGMLTVPLLFLPRGKKFDLVYKDALAKGRMTAELRAEINDMTVRFFHLAELVLLGVVVFLMIFKLF